MNQVQIYQFIISQHDLERMFVKSGIEWAKQGNAAALQRCALSPDECGPLLRTEAHC